MSRVVELLESIQRSIGTRMEGGTGSVEIRTSTRGVDVTVKAYCVRPDVHVRVAGDEAMDEFVRVNKELTARLMSNSI